MRMAALHLGPFVNKILKDIIVKSRTLDGYMRRYVPAGIGGHGLPIAMHVRKDSRPRRGKKSSPGVPPLACREYAVKQLTCSAGSFQALRGARRLGSPLSGRWRRGFEAESCAPSRSHQEWSPYKGFKPVPGAVTAARPGRG